METIIWFARFIPTRVGNINAYPQRPSIRASAREATSRKQLIWQACNCSGGASHHVYRVVSQPNLGSLNGLALEAALA